MAMKRKIDREDIIQAGFELMHLQGYGGTGIKDITEKINIPKGSFYNHFKSKQEFGLEVLNYYMTHSMKPMRDILTDQKLTAIERLKSTYQRGIELHKNVNNCKLGCLCGNFSQELGDISVIFSKAIRSAFAEMKDKFRSCIQEAKDKGQISTNRDSELLADFLINGTQGAMLRMKSEQSITPLEQFYEIFFHDVLK